MEGSAQLFVPAIERVDDLAHLDSDVLRLRALEQSYLVNVDADRAQHAVEMNALLISADREHGDRDRRRPRRSGRMGISVLLADETQDPYQTLTPREREVLSMVVNGLTTHDIASRLVLSPNTVHRHRNNLMQKLGLHDRLALLRYCLRRGLIDPAS